MTVRECLLKSAIFFGVVLFFGCIIVTIVAGIVGHFTCDWISQSKWVTWRDECTAARVGAIAMFGFLGLFILFVGVSLITALAFALFKCNRLPSCCQRRNEYLQV